MRPRLFLLLASSLAVVVISGCGGGGDEEATSAPTTTTAPATAALSKAELIEQGDAICAEVNAAAGTVGTSSAEMGSAAGQAAGLYAGMVDSLKNLGAPRESTGYAEFIAAAEEFGTAEDEVQLAAERGDEASLATAESSASSALGSFQAAAEEYGFEQCGAGPSATPLSAAPESGETGTAEAPEEAESETEAAEPEPEVEAEPEVAPETGGASGAGGGTGGGTEGGGGTTGGDSGGIGPG